MKKTLLTLIGLFCLSSAFAQKTEFAIGLNSGLFSYAGNAIDKSTSIIHSTGNVQTTYTNEIYGAKNGISYGLSANLKQLLANNHFILGLDAGIERLRSKIAIDRISSYNGTTTYNYTATGKSYLNTDFINFHPNLGYRIKANQVLLDLTAGFDIGLILKAQEEGNATDQNGTTYTTEVDRKHIKTDIRPRLQLAAKHKKIGVYAGYAYGLSNYYSGAVGGSADASSRLIRFGITYSIYN